MDQPSGTGTEISPGIHGGLDFDNPTGGNVFYVHIGKSARQRVDGRIMSKKKDNLQGVIELLDNVEYFIRHGLVYPWLDINIFYPHFCRKSFGSTKGALCRTGDDPIGLDAFFPEQFCHYWSIMPPALIKGPVNVPHIRVIPARLSVTNKKNGFHTQLITSSVCGSAKVHKNLVALRQFSVTCAPNSINMEFRNKIVWITGASSGIGEHLAYGFAAEGARLILSSRNEKELSRVREGCHKATEVHIVPMDVAALDTIPAIVENVLKTIGPIDILVNNAGISQRDLALQTSLTVDQKIMDVNYFGTLAITKVVAPVMQARKSGQIVVISSVLGKMGVPYRSAYAASKHALQGFFDSLRAELYRDNITVTVICPGYVFTNVTANALKGDGTPNAVIAESTRSGFPPDVFAQKALQAIRKQRREVVIAKQEGLGVLLQRFVPGIYARIARNMKLN